MKTTVQQDVALLRRFSALTESEKSHLEGRLRKMNLLGADLSNAKLAKSAAATDWRSFILYLSPEKSAGTGLNLCPHASAGCAAACLNTAGRGRFDSVQLARLRKTLFFQKMRPQFLTKLAREIGALSKKHGPRLAIRLNGTSDLPWHRLVVPGQDGPLSLIDLFPGVTFYDYTPNLGRVLEKVPANYSLTFSRKEDNDDEVLTALAAGVNVAAVFAGPELPGAWNGFEVINGDAHDLRFLDPRGSRGFVVGLLAKGQAKADDSGFVLDSSSETAKVA